MYKIGLIGAGKMGMSIVEGIINSNVVSKEEIIIAVRSEKRKSELNCLGYNVTLDSKKAYQESDCFILAVKPQSFEDVLGELKDVEKESLIISVAAGIKIEYINKYLKGRIARVMPNTPAIIKAGTSAITIDGLTKEDLNTVKKIFESIGSVSLIEESLMDEIIPCNGSMPAYVFSFMNGFIKAAVKVGVSEEVAKELVVNSVIGSAKLVLASDKSIEQLINDVCSPGGTTIEGIKALEDGEFEKTIEKCYNSCMNRSKELGKMK